MFRPRLRIPRVRLPQASPSLLRRSLHAVPATVHNPEVGIPGLLSNDSFHLAYTEYMQFVIEKLNHLVADTDLEDKDTLQIVKTTAREPSQAPIFNYASMAHNTHFFFTGLKSTDENIAVPSSLEDQLVNSFGSIETLRREMILTASAMFGPGFVWLVKNHTTQSYRVLATYLAGSPYREAHWRRQGTDMNTNEGPSSIERTGVSSELLARSNLAAGAGNGTRWAQATAPGGIEVMPVLCVNTWEHVWLRDYGVGAGGVGGKRMFLENWWHAIDWNKAEERALARPKNMVF